MTALATSIIEALSAVTRAIALDDAGDAQKHIGLARDMVYLLDAEAGGARAEAQGATERMDAMEKDYAKLMRK